MIRTLLCINGIINHVFNLIVGSYPVEVKFEYMLLEGMTIKPQGIRTPCKIYKSLTTNYQPKRNVQSIQSTTARAVTSFFPCKILTKHSSTVVASINPSYSTLLLRPPPPPLPPFLNSPQMAFTNHPHTKPWPL